MSTREAKFTSINYDNLFENLVFTDISIDEFSDEFILAGDIMIEFIERSNNSLIKLNDHISLNIHEKIEKILLIFPFAETQENFIKNVNSLFKKCVTQFPDAIITLGIFRNWAGLSPEMKIIELENAFINAKELSNFIHYRFAEKQIRFNYARCHHILLNYLKKRCKNGVNFKFDAKNSDNFYISNNKTMMLSFVRNATDKSYYVYVNSQNNKFIFKLTNSHLLGLYNPSLLFKVASLLLEIKNFTDCDIQIVDNEIVLLDYQGAINSKKVFEEIISKFDHFFKSYSKNFKIQLFPDKKIVLNRSLKILLPLIENLLRRGAIKLLIDLSFSYFKCFSIAPICCRMQSVAPDAIFYDFEKFTYSHINRYRCNYIKICKLLFPFVANVEDAFLLRKYLEIVPVTLIGRLHGSYFQHFLTTLKTLEELDIKVIPLANGNFKLSSFFTVTPEMLTKIVDPLKIQAAINELRKWVVEENLELVMHEDVECNSQNYFEIENNCCVINFFNHECCFYNLRNSVSCPNEIPCYSSASYYFLVFAAGNCQILAFKVMKKLLSLKISELCLLFFTAFDPFKSSLFYPFCHNFFGSINNIFCPEDNKTAGYIPLEAPDDSYNFWIYDERFLFEKKIPKKYIQTFVSELKSFSEDEGIPLAFVKDKVVTLENVQSSIVELNPDNYKATADY